jgi:hypothetical protein
MGLTAFVLILALGAGRAAAGETGWKRWVPFIGDKESPASEAAPVKKSSPSLLTRVGTGTKHLALKTKKLVAFATFQKSKPQPPIWGTTTRSSKNQSGSRSSRDSGVSFWNTMFQREKPKQPQTVTEFLKQDRPGF